LKQFISQTWFETSDHPFDYCFIWNHIHRTAPWEACPSKCELPVFDLRECLVYGVQKLCPTLHWIVELMRFTGMTTPSLDCNDDLDWLRHHCANSAPNLAYLSWRPLMATIYFLNSFQTTIIDHIHCSTLWFFCWLE